jgi:hypothetical protein
MILSSTPSKVKVNLAPALTKAYGGMQVWHHEFISWAVGEGELHVPAALRTENDSLHPVNRKVESSPKFVRTFRNAPAGNRSAIRRDVQSLAEERTTAGDQKIFIYLFLARKKPSLLRKSQSLVIPYQYIIGLSYSLVASVSGHVIHPWPVEM